MMVTGILLAMLTQYALLEYFPKYSHWSIRSQNILQMKNNAADDRI